jgi:hypothetical protein
MQSAREPFLGRATAASAPRAPAINRTLVWFSGDAERRRRTAAAAQQALSRRGAYLAAMVRRGTAWLGTLPPRAAAPSDGARGASPRAAVWQRSEVFGCVALAALALAVFEAPLLPQWVPASAGRSLRCLALAPIST